jgi:hypothetical protein
VLQLVLPWVEASQGTLSRIRGAPVPAPGGAANDGAWIRNGDRIVLLSGPAFEVVRIHEDPGTGSDDAVPELGAPERAPVVRVHPPVRPKAPQTSTEAPIDLDRLAHEAEASSKFFTAIIRRAAFDWVLYRDSTRPAQKELADEAYEWLFVETPAHPSWRVRRFCRRETTSFLSICELLDLDPERVRAHVRCLTRQRVMSIGRPKEWP